nr:MAG TPA: hypothetical protein [Caudoviricetes sp.]
MIDNAKMIRRKSLRTLRPRSGLVLISYAR